MGEWTTLKAADGHEFQAWRSARAESMAGLVVAQEIFGVNEHIRQVADRYATLGFAAVAPDGNRALCREASCLMAVGWGRLAPNAV